MKKIGLVLFLFLILGGLFVYRNFYVGQEENTLNQDNNFMKIGENAIVIFDQQPNSYIVISLVSLKKEGYVAIYSNNQGQPGQIIGGSKLLPKGESRDITANLNRLSIDGESLFGILHDESGDDIFSPNLDIPIRDDQDNIIYTRFNISRKSSIPVEINL